MMIELGTMLFSSIFTNPFVAIFLVVIFDNCAKQAVVPKANRRIDMEQNRYSVKQFYAIITMGRMGTLITLILTGTGRTQI